MQRLQSELHPWYSTQFNVNFSRVTNQEVLSKGKENCSFGNLQDTDTDMVQILHNYRNYYHFKKATNLILLVKKLRNITSDFADLLIIDGEEYTPPVNHIYQ